MNNQLQEFAREILIEGLLKLPEANQMIFKRMYSHKDLTLPIEEVVAAMPDERLDWAMQQVQRSLDMEVTE